jgi:6-phospho-beta-glucosidase
MSGGRYARYQYSVLKGEIMSQKLKVVTIGGGSSYTPELLEGFIKRYHELPVSELWLVDVEGGKAKLDIIFDANG